MSREANEWIPVQAQKGRQTPAVFVAIPGSVIAQAIKDSRIPEGITLTDMEVRRIAVKTQKRKARVILEFRQRQTREGEQAPSPIMPTLASIPSVGTE